MTTKIFDNTVISSSINEIESINLIEKCLERYSIVTSIEVYEETKKGFPEQSKESYKKISIFDLKDNKLFAILIEYLSDRYPYLHKGELSSFLVSLIEYEMKDKEYYFVTDDNRMRKAISKIFEDNLFVSKLTHKPLKFNMTGTVGLLKRLCQRNILTKKDVEKVIADLENSSFYITPELIKYLKAC